MGLTKQQKHKNSLIQKEQQQLLKIQKELDSLLIKLNEGINVLKVEELQLKSSAALFDNQNDANMQQEKRDNPPPLDLKPSVSQSTLKRTQENPSLDLDVSKHKRIDEYEEDEDEI